MLETLNFVRGAVAEKNRDLIPVLTHFCIYQGRIQGQDGRLSIDAPCPELTFDGVVPADRFLKAADACGGEPVLKLTDKGKLSVTRKPFRATLPVQAVEAFPRNKQSEGKVTALQGGKLLQVLKQLRPFMSDDAERPWASTIYFDSTSHAALATTNAMIGMVECQTFKEDIQIPVFCVDELMRIGDQPTHYISDPTSITFLWGDRWLKAQKINAEWPVLTARKWLSMSVKLKPLPADLADTIERILPFCNDPKFPVIYFKASGLSTAPGDVQAEISGLDLGEAAFHAENLLPMLRCCDKMAITKDAAFFSGPNTFKGVMSLLRLA